MKRPRANESGTFQQRRWRVLSSPLACIASLFILITLIIPLDQGSFVGSLFHGRVTRCYIGEGLCVWRTQSGAFHVDYSDYGTHENPDRTDAHGDPMTHYACVEPHYRGVPVTAFFAPTRAEQSRWMRIYYDDRVAFPNETALRTAVVEFGKINDHPWAHDDLALGDVTHTRPLPFGYVVNTLAATLAVFPMCAIVRMCRHGRLVNAEIRLRDCCAHERCFACGYDLRGIASDVCPECGKPTPAELLSVQTADTAPPLPPPTLPR